MKDLAKAVLLAQEIHEQSWNGKGHNLDQHQAAFQASIRLNLPEEIVEPVYLLNYLAWNDIQEWAKSVVG